MKTLVNSQVNKNIRGLVAEGPAAPAPMLMFYRTTSLDCISPSLKGNMISLPCQIPLKEH